MSEQKKQIDKLWDLIFALNEDEDNIRGKVSFRKDSYGEGMVAVVIDGRPLTIHIDAGGRHE